MADSFSEKEVSILFKTARRALRHPGLDILCAPTTKKNGRILVITARSTGTAPKRNLIRRRLKAIFFEEKLFELKFDCIVIIKKIGINLTFEQLRELLVGTLKKYEENFIHRNLAD